VITVGEPPSSNGIEIDNQTKDQIDEAAVQSLVVHHLAALQIAADCELSISLVDEETMTDLHVRWMDEPGPTDVLSFPMDELTIPGQGEPAPFGVLGDIIVCPSFVRVQAEEKGRTLDEEVQFLITHGILHLLGLDHSEPDDEEAMFSLQDDLLNDWIRSTQEAGTA
jgi:probable rRNA maturation factor